MKAELIAIIEQAPEGGYWALCAEVPGANGQGKTVEEAKQNLREAIQAQLSRTAGSSARPLLPADGEGDEAAISCGAWDKYGGVEHRRPHQNDEPVFAASDLRSRPRAPSRRANDQRHRAADGVRPAHDRQMDPD